MYAIQWGDTPQPVGPPTLLCLVLSPAAAPLCNDTVCLDKASWTFRAQRGHLLCPGRVGFPSPLPEPHLLTSARALPTLHCDGSLPLRPCPRGDSLTRSLRHSSIHCLTYVSSDEGRSHNRLWFMCCVSSLKSSGSLSPVPGSSLANLETC